MQQVKQSREKQQVSMSTRSALKNNVNTDKECWRGVTCLCVCVCVCVCVDVCVCLLACVHAGACMSMCVCVGGGGGQRGVCD